MTLGQMLTWHRQHCTSCDWCPACKRGRTCHEYAEITAEFTEARRLYAGTTAPHAILSVREGQAT